MEDGTIDSSEELSPEFEDLEEKSTSPGKYHKQSYRKAWESLPDFKGWLRGVDGQPNRAFCSYCQVSLFAHRLSLLKHTCTLKHQRASQKALLKNNGMMAADTNVSLAQSSSQARIQQISADDFKISICSEKGSPNLTNNMTVTIIQDEIDEPLELQLGHDIADGDDSMIADDDDLGLNTMQTAKLRHPQEPLVETPISKHLIMAQPSKSPLTTHVLDTSKGQPVPQLPVSLYRLIDSRWTLVNESITNKDGRCISLIQREEFVAGRYKLHFDTDRYFELDRKETLYPFVEIVFDVHAPIEHYHIPLLLSAFGYSTYRGS